MRFTLIGMWLPAGVIALGLTLVTPAAARGHCDGLDGPVVKAAQKALETQNAALVLVWVQPEDEPEIRTAFEQTLSVRALGPRAQELADRYFFETVVRVHRAGEGAPFTGLKPAGRELGPAIPAADRAVEDGSLQTLHDLLAGAMRDRLRDHFDAVVRAKSFKTDDLTAGRAFVKAYVEYIHFVERLYEAATNAPQGHFDEPQPDDHAR
jgi:hypothetical protein